MWIKKGITSAILASLMYATAGFASTPSQEAVRAFATGGSVDSASVAVLIIDLDNGRQIGAWQSRQPMIPASVMKCITTATLLEKVGKDWRYETPVYCDGMVIDKVLEGNVIVEGSADPSLNTVHEPGSKDLVAEIVSALKSAGIDTVRGKILIDESRFKGPSINPGWVREDLPHAYGTGTHGFNFEDNSSGKKSVSNPSGVFIRRLTSALAKENITIQNRKMSEGSRQLLCTHRSEPVSEVMRSCMMRSDNQFAEGLLRTISSEYGKDGSTASGAAIVRDHWKRKGVDAKGVEIIDGSGLSRDNRLTAEFLGGVLKEMADNPWYASYFPLAGQEGTLRHFLTGTPLEGYVAMKTGSMRGIQCYAGYKINEDYEPTHVIVIMINNMNDRTRAREGVKTMLEGIFLN